MHKGPAGPFTLSFKSNIKGPVGPYMLGLKLIAAVVTISITWGLGPHVVTASNYY